MPEKIQKKRITLLDIILGSMIAAGFFWFVYRMNVVIEYKWNWAAIPEYMFRFDSEKRAWVPNMIIEGFLTTIRLSFWAMILAMALGMVMGFLRSGNRLFGRLISGVYVQIVRNTPPLVLIFIFYYFISTQIMNLFGVEDFVANLSSGPESVIRFCFSRPSLFPAFLSALFTLAVFEGAYITEIVRAGIESVEKGQWEASAALGLSWIQQMRHVIWPQAGRIILPPLSGQFISTIKDSAIVSVISIPELTFAGTEIMASTFMTFEIWITIALLYLILTLSCSIGTDMLERSMKKGRGRFA
ncbi:amino acid ABC transporter permease [Desulfobacterales bacterium HSG16]|nr:amino acid ABC transporter permease [Desulfobacterales bacterium HSG16]